MSCWGYAAILSVERDFPLHDITLADVDREGAPAGFDCQQFLARYFPGEDSNSKVTRVRFQYVGSTIFVCCFDNAIGNALIIFLAGMADQEQLWTVEEIDTPAGILGMFKQNVVTLQGSRECRRAAAACSEMIRTRCTYLATLDLDLVMDFHEKKAKKAQWTKEKIGPSCA